MSKITCIVSIGFVSLLFPFGHAVQKTYVVGGWQTQTPGQPPQTPATIAKVLAPVFQDYLTEAVGKKMNPPAKFVFRGVDIDASTSSRDLIAAEQLDFLYTLSGGLACRSAEFSWVPIATQRNIVGSTEFGSDALVVLSLKNNTKISSVGDLNGKKLGCGYLWSGTTYLQGYQMLRDHGLHIYRDMTQVRFHGPDYEAYYQAILRGEIDVGFVASSWLVKNHPKDMDQLLVHERKDGLTYEGAVYPYPVSKLTPTYGLIASDKIDWELKRKVLAALELLNASHPGMKLMKIAGWTSTMNYGIAYTSLVNSGVVYDTEAGGKRCRDPFNAFDIWQSIVCPSGFFKADYNLSMQQCGLAGLACPSGAICFCRPCLPLPQNLFSWETVVYLCAALYGAGGLYVGLPRLLDALSVSGLACAPGSAEFLPDGRSQRGRRASAEGHAHGVEEGGGERRGHSPRPHKGDESDGDD